MSNPRNYIEKIDRLEYIPSDVKEQIKPDFEKIDEDLKEAKDQIKNNLSNKEVFNLLFV